MMSESPAAEQSCREENESSAVRIRDVSEEEPCPSSAVAVANDGTSIAEDLIDDRFRVTKTERHWKVDVFARTATITKALNQAKETKQEKQIAFYEEQLEVLVIDEDLFRSQRIYQKASGNTGADEEEDGGSSGSGGGSGTHRRLVALGAQGSLVLNIFLLFIKLYAALRTGSTTILASLVDSILDLMSGAIMIVVNCMYDRSSSDLFPAGKHHFEPLGTLVFACAMFISATNLFQEVAAEVQNMDNIVFVMDASTVLILLTVIGLKTFAAMWCFKSARGSLTLIALAEDHRNDVVANIVALVGFVAATLITPWIDPILALCVTLFILKVWGSQVLEQLHALSGHVAEPALLNAVTMLARNHDARVLLVDTVRAFTSGTGYVVEVDFVLPEDMPLKEAHDIGERFQYFLERAEGLNIARAYVHLDTETDHNPHLHL